MTDETPERRLRRERNRILFDGVASLYDATRQSYPLDVVHELLTTAQLAQGSRVLEVGCGTGQLTSRLAGRGLRITAVDIGAEMVRLARRNVVDRDVSFHCASFEEFESTESFDLIVSATAFHWIDPAVAFSKSVALLRPGGWLALLTTGERHHEPVRSALRELWIKHHPAAEKWQPSEPWAVLMRATGLFGDVTELISERPLQLSVSDAVDVECTRATFLSWGLDIRQAFRRDLAALLQNGPSVEVVQETSLTMAPALRT